MIQWIKSAEAIRMPPAITPRRPDAAIKATVAAARTTESTVRLSRLPLAVCTTASELPTRIAYSGNDHRGSSRTSTAKAPAAPPTEIAPIAGTRNRSIPGEGPFAVWMSEASTGEAWTVRIRVQEWHGDRGQRVQPEGMHQVGAPQIVGGVEAERTGRLTTQVRQQVERSQCDHGNHHVAEAEQRRSPSRDGSGRAWGSLFLCRGPCGTRGCRPSGAGVAQRDPMHQAGT